MTIEKLLSIFINWQNRTANTELASMELFSDGSGKIVNGDEILTQFDTTDELIAFLRN